MSPAPKMAGTTTKQTAGERIQKNEQTAALPGALDYERVARLAYSYWEARGCPIGSPEEDWFRAEHELMMEQLVWGGERSPQETSRPAARQTEKKTIRHT